MGKNQCDIRIPRAKKNVRVFQSIFKEIKFSIFYCFRHINYTWDPSKMATKIVFLNFPYVYGVRAMI